VGLFEYLQTLLSSNIVLYALIAGVLLSLTAALLGVSLVLKKFSMIGDGLSHVSFAALSVAVATRQAPLAFSIPIVILAAFLLLRISENSKIKGDAAIAVISTASLAIGAIAARGTNVDVESYMFGSVVSITFTDVVLTIAVTVVTLLVYVFFFNRIFAVTFDENYVRAGGGHPSLYNALIAVLTAVTVVVGMRLVGALLISALIIFPALSSMRLFKSFRRVVISSCVIAVLSFVISLFISLFFDIPTGATIVLLDLFVFGLASLVLTIKDR